VPKEFKPEEMKFVESARGFKPKISEWEFFQAMKTYEHLKK
jgi:hypothetical protein